MDKAVEQHVKLQHLARKTKKQQHQQHYDNSNVIHVVLTANVINMWKLYLVH